MEQRTDNVKSHNGDRRARTRTFCRSIRSLGPGGGRFRRSGCRFRAGPGRTRHESRAGGQAEGIAGRTRRGPRAASASRCAPSRATSRRRFPRKAGGFDRGSRSGSGRVQCRMRSRRRLLRRGHVGAHARRRRKRTRSGGADADARDRRWSSADEGPSFSCPRSRATRAGLVSLPTRRARPSTGVSPKASGTDQRPGDRRDRLLAGAVRTPGYASASGSGRPPGPLDPEVVAQRALRALGPRPSGDTRLRQPRGRLLHEAASCPDARP